MTQVTLSWVQLAIAVAAGVVGIGGTLVGAVIYQTHYIDKRIDDMRELMAQQFRRAEEMTAQRFKEVIDHLGRNEEMTAQRFKQADETTAQRFKQADEIAIQRFKRLEDLMTERFRHTDERLGRLESPLVKTT
jgi:hypothetical protein